MNFITESIKVAGRLFVLIYPFIIKLYTEKNNGFHNG